MITKFNEFNELNENKTNVGKIAYNIGDIVYDTENGRYGLVMNNYGDAYNGDSGDIRLDSDGNQAIYTHNAAGDRIGYNLVKMDMSKPEFKKMQEEHLDGLRKYKDNYRKEDNLILYQLINGEEVTGGVNEEAAKSKHLEDKYRLLAMKLYRDTMTQFHNMIEEIEQSGLDKSTIRELKNGAKGMLQFELSKIVRDDTRFK